MGRSIKGLILGTAFLALPGFLAAQSQQNEQERIEVVRLRLNGVKAVDVAELRNSIATEASHCISSLFIPLCWITQANYVYEREYLNREELARDILRTRVFYWKRGYREAAVDTLVTPRGKDKVEVAFNIAEGSPTMVSRIGVTQTNPVLTQREIDDRLVLGANSPLN